MVGFTLRMICLSTDGYCIVLEMEATISMKLLEKITVNSVRAVFEQMHCGIQIAVGREGRTWCHSSPKGCSLLPSVVTPGRLLPLATVKLALGWSCWKCILSKANSACYG